MTDKSSDIKEPTQGKGGVDSALNKLKEGAKKAKQQELDNAIKQAHDACIVFKKSVELVKRLEKELGGVNQEFDELKRFM